MSPPSPAMIQEVRSQLSSIMDTPVGNPDMAEIDRELTPILKELMQGRPSTVSKEQFTRDLFDWLVHPQRTAKEFNYVVGPLAHSVGYTYYLGMTALEALASKCPVLEGPWELAVWLVIRNILTDYQLYGSHSNRMSIWIIQVVGNADICPNPCLRLELMHCLLGLVKIDMHNQTQVIEAVMSACSDLTIDYLLSNHYGYYSVLDFVDVITIFSFVTDLHDNYLSEFGEKLAKGLHDVNTLRLSSTLHDVSYECGLNSNKCTEPRELKSLIALLNTTAGYARRETKKLEEHDEDKDWSGSDNAYTMFKILVYCFKSCFNMPQLSYPTATCIMDVLEFVLIDTFCKDDGDSDSEFDDIDTDDDVIVSDIEHLLEILLTDEDSLLTLDNSAIGQEVIFRYGGRLRSIRQRIGGLNIYPTIYSLLNLA